MIRLDWRGGGLAGRQLEAAAAAGHVSTVQPGRFTSRHATGISLRDALRELGVDPDSRMLIMLRGERIDVAALASTSLEDGDEIALLPSLRAG